MLWCQQDFEREVSRQLVEIESIRKRAAGSPEVSDRLDRLEESILHLMRKLRETLGNGQRDLESDGGSEADAEDDQDSLPEDLLWDLIGELKELGEIDADAWVTAIGERLRAGEA